jgi:hypothetical protein
LATFVGAWTPAQDAQAFKYKGVKREFSPNNLDNPKINETLAGIPADMYNIPEMTVRKGDIVVIYFLNVEPEANDKHSFTVRGGTMSQTFPWMGDKTRP